MLAPYLRVREVKLVSLIEDVLPRELVGDEELSEIADNLGRGSDLDDVSALRERGMSAKTRRERCSPSSTHQLIGVDVRLDDLLPLASKTELLRLEHEVRVLTCANGEMSQQLNRALRVQIDSPPGISWSKTPESEARTLASLRAGVSAIFQVHHALCFNAQASVELTNRRPVQVEGLNIGVPIKGRVSGPFRSTVHDLTHEIPVPSLVCSSAEQTAPIDG